MLFTILKYVLVSVEFLCSALLIVVILIQRTKNQGMGLAFGSGVGESLFGSQVGNVLTKTTVILGIVFLVNTTILAVMTADQRAAKSLADEIPSVPMMPAQPMTGGGGIPMPAPDAGGIPMPPAPDGAPSVDLGQPATVPAPAAVAPMPPMPAMPAAPAVTPSAE